MTHGARTGICPLTGQPERPPRYPTVGLQSAPVDVARADFRVDATIAVSVPESQAKDSRHWCSGPYPLLLIAHRAPSGSAIRPEITASSRNAHPQMKT